LTNSNLITKEARKFFLRSKTFGRSCTECEINGGLEWGNLDYNVIKIKNRIGYKNVIGRMGVKEIFSGCIDIGNCLSFGWNHCGNRISSVLDFCNNDRYICSGTSSYGMEMRVENRAIKKEK